MLNTMNIASKKLYSTLTKPNWRGDFTPIEEVVTRCAWSAHKEQPTNSGVKSTAKAVLAGLNTASKLMGERMRHDGWY